jgi:hypothetical protein
MMKINEKQCKSMEINENQWKSMKINENQWKSMKINENQLKSLIFNEIYRNQWNLWIFRFRDTPEIVVPLLKSNHGDLVFVSGIRGGIQLIQIN